MSQKIETERGLFDIHTMVRIYLMARVIRVRRDNQELICLKQ